MRWKIGSLVLMSLGICLLVICLTAQEQNKPSSVTRILPSAGWRIPPVVVGMYAPFRNGKSCRCAGRLFIASEPLKSSRIL